jgi:ribonuclease BN (tRNA processing enzyme)
MKLTVLGNNGPFPGPGGACSGYLLSSDSGETNVLLDCGSGVLSRLAKRIEIGRLDAILLSHLHFDHMSDMTVLKYALPSANRKRNLPVVSPSEPRKVLEMMEDSRLDFLEPKDMTIGEMRVSFVPAIHPVPAISIKVECDGKAFVYTGDTNINPFIELFADGADMLLADAGLTMAQWSESAPHLSARHCGEIARNARVGALMLTHIRPGNDPEALLDEARAVYPAAQIAEPEMSYLI